MTHRNLRPRPRPARILTWTGCLLAVALLVLVFWHPRDAPSTDRDAPAPAAAASSDAPVPTPGSADAKAAPAPAWSAGTDSSPATLISAASLPGNPAIPPEAGVPPARRVRVAAIDSAWLDRKRSPLFDPAAIGTMMPLPLWPDRTLQVRLLGSEVVGEDRRLVRGEIVGYPGSRFLLATTGEAMAFSVYLDPEERHGGVPLRAGEVAIYELDPTASPGCAGALPALADSNALAEANARPFALRTGQVFAGIDEDSGAPPMAAAVPGASAQVDVLVLYTGEVSANAQAPANLVARVDLSVGEANDEYAHSETRVALRLVGLRQAVYTETGSNSTTLGRLRVTNDGFMDDAHALRDELGADLVCLMVQRTDPGNIGIAYVMDSVDDPERSFNDLFGFSVVQNAWFAGSSTFAHELGHNLGCAHDRQNSTTAGAFSYSYGYRFTGADNRTYRTIMAYQPGIAVPYFSNPRLTHSVAQRALGVAAGLPGEADNAQSINRVAHAIASYRANLRDAPARGRFYNVSTRAWVGTGENALIGGFFVGSPGPKQVLLRVRGPALAPFNVPDVLLDPQLELVNQTTGQTITVNDDWATAPNAGAITATGLAPTDAREPAILMALEPGGYTAIARGEGATTGIALIEVFEVEGGSVPKLVNLSTRGFIDTGDRVMIGGIIVNGVPGETKRLLFRALGPSLENFNVANPLSDPALRLYNESGDELLDNDDWDYLSDAVQARVRTLDLDPAVRRESVLLVDLPPGAYTLIVRPFENEEGAEPGVGLIEAYEITTP